MVYTTKVIINSNGIPVFTYVHSNTVTYVFNKTFVLNSTYEALIVQLKPDQGKGSAQFCRGLSQSSRLAPDNNSAGRITPYFTPH